MENKNLIQTSDLTLASTLLCYGYDVIGINSENPSRVFFYFLDSAEIQNAIKSYWNDKLKVSPRIMQSYRKQLLNRIFQGGLQR
jgi:hypothetical protein